MQRPEESLPEQSQIWQQVKNYLLERMKEILEAMIEGERDRYIKERGGRKNGYWRRSLETELGKIDELRVARGREGGFYPSTLQPYARRVVELSKLIIALYEAGVSTRKISAILRRFYGSEASAALISSVTERIAEKLKKWRSRPLPRRFAVLLHRRRIF